MRVSVPMAWETSLRSAPVRSFDHDLAALGILRDGAANALDALQVARQREDILQLLAHEAQALLNGVDALLAVDIRLDVTDGVAGHRHREELHVTALAPHHHV